MSGSCLQHPQLKQGLARCQYALMIALGTRRSPTPCFLLLNSAHYIRLITLTITSSRSFKATSHGTTPSARGELHTQLLERQQVFKGNRMQRGITLLWTCWAAAASAGVPTLRSRKMHRDRAQSAGRKQVVIQMRKEAVGKAGR